LQPIRVLIVDDSAIVQSLVRMILGSIPEIEIVATARQADEARRQILNEDIDVVLLDLELPDDDGLEVLDFAVAMRSLGVVVMSAGASRRNQALERGASAFHDKVTIVENRVSLVSSIVAACPP
jgi:two-component system, chemotaxis family, protein-glutamate methylesterase/glutaminase